MDGVHTGARRGMSRRDRRRVFIVIAIVTGILFVAGGFAAWFSRNDTICSDGKPPKAQRDMGLGQTEYLCHNGQLVTK
jgi:hypothetical protein